LAKDQKLNFGDEIAYQLRLARKKRFNVVEERRVKEEIELQTYLNRLIEMDRNAQLNKLKSDIDNITVKDGNTLKELTHMINITFDKRLSDLNSMFSALDIRRKVFLLSQYCVLFFINYKLKYNIQ
jgi:STIP1 homology and U-box containing protein 1